MAENVASCSSASHQAYLDQLYEMTREYEESLKSPPVSDEYLSDLMQDLKVFKAFNSEFSHIGTLLEKEIRRVRHGGGQLCLPSPRGPMVSLHEKIYVPVKEFPNLNFIGRLIGPKGKTAKLLEAETGCKIMIRGNGSMRTGPDDGTQRGTRKHQHLEDELHVIITVRDTENRASLKLQKGVAEVKKFLLPWTEGEDELKNRQLLELAFIKNSISLQANRRVGPPTTMSHENETLEEEQESDKQGASGGEDVSSENGLTIKGTSSTSSIRQSVATSDSVCVLGTSISPPPSAGEALEEYVNQENGDENSKHSQTTCFNYPQQDLDTPASDEFANAGAYSYVPPQLKEFNIRSQFSKEDLQTSNLDIKRSTAFIRTDEQRNTTPGFLRPKAMNQTNTFFRLPRNPAAENPRDNSNGNNFRWIRNRDASRNSFRNDITTNPTPSTSNNRVPNAVDNRGAPVRRIGEGGGSYNRFNKPRGYRGNNLSSGDPANQGLGPNNRGPNNTNQNLGARYQGGANSKFQNAARRIINDANNRAGNTFYRALNMNCNKPSGSTGKVNETKTGGGFQATKERSNQPAGAYIAPQIQRFPNNSLQNSSLYRPQPTTPTTRFIRFNYNANRRNLNQGDNQHDASTSAGEFRPDAASYQGERPNPFDQDSNQ